MSKKEKNSLVGGFVKSVAAKKKKNKMSKKEPKNKSMK